ncbi:MAG: hypothetical protein ABIK33_05285 [candidate division WOR-3 bacterium]
MNKTLNHLKTQYELPAEIFKHYAFELRNDKLFVMTKQVKQFDKIKSIRKGLIFAIKKRRNFIIKEDVLNMLLKNLR